ncbi:hypothetical protein ACJX0J_020881, partial [Zea mays]
CQLSKVGGHVSDGICEMIRRYIQMESGICPSNKLPSNVAQHIFVGFHRIDNYHEGEELFASDSGITPFKELLRMPQTILIKLYGHLTTKM